MKTKKELIRVFNVAPCHGQKWIRRDDSENLTARTGWPPMVWCMESGHLRPGIPCTRPVRVWVRPKDGILRIF